jgi:ribonuclease VapC
MGPVAARQAKVIVIDTSAVIAILYAEALGPALAERMAADAQPVMSVGTYIEAGTVIAGRDPVNPFQALGFLERFMANTGTQLRPVDEAQARLALEARIRYGRGMGHGGTLNYGDTFAYALAKSLDAPLLFVGDDFSKTDVRAALDLGQGPT